MNNPLHWANKGKCEYCGKTLTDAQPWHCDDKVCAALATPASAKEGE